MFWSNKYKGYYISGKVENGIETIDVCASPTGYGYTWRKTGLKSLHAAKLAISKHIKENPGRDNIDEFTKGYIICALWSSNDNSDDQGGRALDENHDIDDISIETLKQMVEDCTDFQKANKALLRKYCELRAKFTSPEYSPIECAGHDFWLTRNGHGAGFWDRGNNIVFDKLTQAAKVYSGVDLYIGDDGKIYG